MSCKARYPLAELTEREVEGFDTRIEKFNLKLAIDNRLRLTNQLVEPLLGSCAVALAVNVDPARSARRLSIDRQIPHSRSPRGQAGQHRWS